MSILDPDDYADRQYVAGLNQMGHMVAGGAAVIMFGLVGAAICIALLELWQFYYRDAEWTDAVADTAFWAYGMAFFAASWFLPSVIVIGGIWMGLVWYMSR